MKVIPLEKKLSRNSLKSYHWMQHTEKATASHGNRKECNLGPWSRWAALPWSFQITWLLEATAHCRQPFRSPSSHTCFPKCISPQERGKTKENYFQRETPCPGKTFCLTRWEQETRLRNRCFYSRPPQPALCDKGERSFLFRMQHSSLHDLGGSWPNGQQHTSHTISINDKSLITYTACKGIFFWKCTHCLVIYLLRSLIKGQQS